MKEDLAFFQERLKSFLGKAPKDARIGLYFDRDPDGISAGTLAFHALEGMFGRAPDYCQDLDFPDINRIPEQVREKNLGLVLVVDVALDSRPDLVKGISERALLINLDHHKHYHAIDSERALLIKSQFFSSLDPSKHPTSKLVYDLFSGFTDLSACDWVACVGLLGDVSYEPWKEFFDATARKWKTEKKDFETVMELVSAVETVEPEKFMELFREFTRAKDPAILLRSPLNRYRALLQSELDKWIGEFDAKARKFPEEELVLYDVQPKYNIRSQLSTVLSFRMPHTTLVVLQEFEEGKIRFSGRRQDGRERMNDLLEKAVQGLPDSVAGGHAPAAAGSIPLACRGKFEENLHALLRSLRK